MTILGGTYPKAAAQGERDPDRLRARAVGGLGCSSRVDGTPRLTTASNNPPRVSTTTATFARSSQSNPDAVDIACIAKETGLSRQTIYRIKDDPASAEAVLAAWGL
jgi:putative DNA-invertase from lambdoid prophage Rac